MASLISGLSGNLVTRIRFIVNRYGIWHVCILVVSLAAKHCTENDCTQEVVPTVQGCGLFHYGQLETTAWLDAAKLDALRKSGCNALRLSKALIKSHAHVRRDLALVAATILIQTAATAPLLGSLGYESFSATA